MAHQSVNTKLHHIDAYQTDFYKSDIHLIDQNEALRRSLLNTSTINTIAQDIAENEQFSAAYRSKLADKILSQYTNSNIVLDETDLVFKNIQKLKQNNTFTVTTGQQIHVLLGPFFVVNKILSCCAEAIAVEKELQSANVVPIFWMASEDHDFDEIKSVRLYNETYTWDIDSNGPVGRLNPSSLLELVKKARERIDQTPDNLQFINLCETAYSTCETFADATRYILHHLFSETGIIVLDPDDAMLKKQFEHVVSADLTNHLPSKKIDECIAEMKSFGVKPPINTRPINTFYITDNKRVRIEKTNNGYALVDGSEAFTSDELLKLLDLHPERFSPNALLRPMYQQTILPNVSYITGASEIIYWLELKKAMTSFGITFPELPVRKSVFFISEKNIQKLDNEGIPMSSLFLSEDRLRLKIMEKQHETLLNLSAKIEQKQRDLSDIIETIKSLGSKQTNKLQKINNQLISALKKEHSHITELLSESNSTYSTAVKVKSSLANVDYVQERNKYIISMISEMTVATEHFFKDSTYYRNHKIITVISQ